MPATPTYITKSAPVTLTDEIKQGQGLVVGSPMGPGLFLYLTYSVDLPVVFANSPKSNSVTLTYSTKN